MLLAHNCGQCGWAESGRFEQIERYVLVVEENTLSLSEMSWRKFEIMVLQANQQLKFLMWKRHLHLNYVQLINRGMLMMRILWRKL